MKNDYIIPALITIGFIIFLIWLIKKFKKSGKNSTTPFDTGTGERVPFIVEQGFVPPQQRFGTQPGFQMNITPSGNVGGNSGARVQGGGGVTH